MKKFLILLPVLLLFTGCSVQKNTNQDNSLSGEVIKKNITEELSSGAIFQEVKINSGEIIQQTGEEIIQQIGMKEGTGPISKKTIRFTKKDGNGKLFTFELTFPNTKIWENIEPQKNNIRRDLEEPLRIDIGKETTENYEYLIGNTDYELKLFKDEGNIKYTFFCDSKRLGDELNNEQKEICKEFEKKILPTFKVIK